MKQELSLYLDIVRFSAALIIFLGHAAGRNFTGGLFWQTTPYLQTAVIVFFVLSGFVIGYVTHIKERTLREYWTARIARLSSIVIPALLLTIFCDLIGLSLNRDFYINSPWGYPSNQSANYILSLFLIQNIWDFNLNPGINKPFWSLSFELMYYAIFSAAFFLTGAKRIFTILGLSILAGPTILALFPIWLMGYGSYIVIIRFDKFITRHKFIIGFLSIISLCILIATSPLIRQHFKLDFQFNSRENILADYIEAITFTLHLISSNLLITASKSFLLRFSSIIRWTASLTFALYLFHMPLVQVLVLLSPEDPSSTSTRLIVLGGSFLIVTTIGKWCEGKKTVIKASLDKALTRALPNA